MQVSFLIPLYNCLAHTQAMLASLRATLPRGLTHEIIFIDDGSTDGTRAWLNTLAADPVIRIILHDKNAGFAAANNSGAALARGEFLALLNNDLILTPHWLEPILAAHHAYGPRAGLVGNVQLNAATGVVDHAGIRINLKGKPEHINWLPRRSYWPLPSPRHHRVVAVTGACVVLRRTLWEKLGGFDRAYVNGCEDVDLCLRAAAAGHVNLVALRSRVRHHISTSPGRKLRDEANTRLLVQRWSDTLARHAARLWCRDYLATYLRDPRDFPDAALARQAFFHAWHLRPAPPAGAIAGMSQNLDAELTRWSRLLD